MAWGKGPRRWLPRLDCELGPLYMQLYRYRGGFQLSRIIQSVEAPLSFLTLTGIDRRPVLDPGLTQVDLKHKTTVFEPSLPQI